tara:strand:+ start:439 stop:663 length:225 start_codon:yes stop_codon:yes gene_type:complete
MHGALLSNVWKQDTPKVRLIQHQQTPPSGGAYVQPSNQTMMDILGFSMSIKDMVFIIMICCVLMTIMTFMNMQK